MPMPQAPEYEQALAAHRSGRLEAAQQGYTAILACEPAHAGALHHLGVLLHQRGMHAEAEAKIREALKHQPADADAWANLGAVLRQLGRRKDARESFEQALQIRPQHAAALNNLGIILSETGQSERAIEVLRAADALTPGQVAIHKHLGLSLLHAGRVAEAIPSLRFACEKRPGDLDLQNDFGVALNRLRKHEDAARQFLKVLKAQPGAVSALVNLGDALTQLGQFEDAEKSLRKAVAADPHSAEGHNNLGVALGKQGHHGEAIQHLQESLRLNPEYVPARHNLANEFLSDGNIEAGLDALRNALKLDPQSVPSWYALASTGKHKFSPEEIATVEALLAKPGRAKADMALLHFSLAQAQEKTAPQRSFGHAIHANRLRRADLEARGEGYDPEKHTALVDSLIETFTPELFERLAHLGSDSNLPTFIVGMPRSGTTLTEQVLAAHPEVFAAGELNDLGQLCQEIAGFPACLNAPNEVQLTQIGNEYLDRLKSLGGDSRRVVDKLTLNFLRIGLIAVLFPKAAVIHTRRDARDTALSCFYHNFSAPGLNFTFDLAHLAHYYREYERIMAHWRAVLPRPMHEIVYEEFVADPEPHTRALIAHCGLTWDDRCLSPHRANRRVKTASVLQVREPIYTRSIARWRHFEAELGHFPNIALPPAGVSTMALFAREGRWEEALGAADAVLAKHPTHAHTINNRGVILAKLGRVDDAIAAQKEALRVAPEFAKAHTDLGLLYYSQGNRVNAAACFESALLHDSKHADALHNRGQIRIEDGQIEAGVADLIAANESNPQNPETWNTLAAALQVLGRVDEALVSYARAIALAPNHAMARYNQACARLLRGDFEQGWPEHEWRLHRPALHKIAALKPRWDGKPTGTVLLVAEQGAGDTLQFIRFAAEARRRANRVVAAVPQNLHPILKSVSGVDEWIEKEGAIPAYDAVAPLLSLRHLLGELPSSPDPYIRTDSKRVAHWQTRLPQQGKLRIGLNWQGNPKFARDDLRSIPLREFAPLAEVADLFSLHIGAGRPQLETCGFPITSLSDEFDETLGAFVDTAAAMKSLDLVITSDTSLAHLAGAIGVPVWLILSAAPDWRWRDTGDSTPWYPTMRIFRQTKLRDWSGPIAEVAVALAASSNTKA